MKKDKKKIPTFSNIMNAISKSKSFRREAYKIDMPFKIIKKHLKKNGLVFKNCAGCEFKGKTHIHFFIPIKDKERLDNYEKDSQEQDYFDSMSFKNLRILLEENGILDAIDEIIRKVKKQNTNGGKV